MQYIVKLYEQDGDGGATFKDGGGGRDVLERATFTQFNRQCSLCGGSELRVGRKTWL